MENTLVEDNLEKLMTLSKEDREIVITYFNNWTWSYPAYYSDGKTMAEKLEELFKHWLQKEHPNMTDEDVSEILEWAWESFDEWTASAEYCIDTILDVAHNRNLDDEWKTYYEKYLWEEFGSDKYSL